MTAERDAMVAQRQQRIDDGGMAALIAQLRSAPPAPSAPPAQAPADPSAPAGAGMRWGKVPTPQLPQWELGLTALAAGKPDVDAQGGFESFERPMDDFGPPASPSEIMRSQIDRSMRRHGVGRKPGAPQAIVPESPTAL